nr:DUF4276 family protein [uncultured Albidiferax sp.]
MRKLAVFVEGFTELIFLERLISEIAGSHNIAFEKRKIIGGTTVRRQVISIEARKPEVNHKFYVLLFDCGGDQQVKPRIMEEHQSLTKSGFSAILGLRDVRPTYSRADIPLLEKNLKYGIKTSLAPVNIFLAIMEIEAWFLSEANHFEKIHPELTTTKIKTTLGFNPKSEDMSLREEPASDLKNAYAIVGKQYTKPAKETIESIDYSKMYLELTEKIPNFARLVECINNFLSPQINASH